MITQLTFYLRHSLNDLRVNGQRTFFALLCIAAGVAAIVSLQTLTVMIGDTLTGNLQATNRSDIRVDVESAQVSADDTAFVQGEADGILVSERISFFGASNTIYYISPEGVDQINAWLEETYPGQVQITYPLVITDPIGIFTSSGAGTAINVSTSGNEATAVSPILIDPTAYPFYDEILSLDGTPLSELLQSPTDIVISENVAEILEASVGDILRLSGADADFTLRGIVPTESEVTNPATGIFAALFGFYYLHVDAVQYFSDASVKTDTLYLAVQDPALVGEINAAFLQRYSYFDTTTTADLERQNTQIVDTLNQLVTVMGLVSLLIGSIGIVNTMQVIVRRRTLEIAVLKTMGLQGDQITILFLVEAFIMGIIGSLAGIALGWATTFVIKSVAESLVAQPLAFRIALAPALNGFVVGVVVTTIFGFLPTLSAAQVRPSVVLRPTDSVIPRTGCLQTLGSLILIIAVLTVVAQGLMGGNVSLAFGAVVGAFIAAGFLYLLLLLLIWLIGRFLPPLGIVDLKISLRQMLVTRARGAITLLALVVGVFSLSLITLLADSVRNSLNIALTTSGNVMITAGSETALQEVETLLGTFEDTTYQVVRAYSGSVISIEQNGTVVTEEELLTRIREASRAEMEQVAQFGGAPPDDFDISEVLLESMGSINAFELEQLPEETLIAGRFLTEADLGQPVLVVRESDVIRYLGIQVGDRITLEFTPPSIGFGGGGEPQSVTCEVIGIVASAGLNAGFSTSNVFTLYGAFPETIAAGSIQVFADIPDEQVPALRRQLASIPGTFALETDVLNRLITGLLGTFTAFPTMVAALGLIVGGVVIANSVALSTMERRREIAIMKSIGLQRERVLGMLLLENGILGFIGGLIGVGIGLVALVIFTSATGGGVVPYGTAFLLMLLCVLVALVAAMTTAWGASGEKPLNVLRYE